MNRHVGATILKTQQALDILKYDNLGLDSCYDIHKIKEQFVAQIVSQAQSRQRESLARRTSAYDIGFVSNPHIQDNRPVYENRNKYAKI